MHISLFQKKCLNIYDMALIPIGRREVRVQGDGNCFYRAVARALDSKTDEIALQRRDRRLPTSFSSFAFYSYNSKGTS